MIKARDSHLPQPGSSFFDLLEAQAAHCYEAATLFYAFTTDPRQIEPSLETLSLVKQEAHQIHREATRTIWRQFLTPMDKADMHLLTDQLETIAKKIEGAASRAGLYHFTVLRPELMILVGMLVGISKELLALVQMLRSGFKPEALSPVLKGIHAMESQCDKAFHQAMTKLLNEETDAILVIKWKDVFERVEKAVNQCEKMVVLVEHLQAKYV